MDMHRNKLNDDADLQLPVFKSPLPKTGWLSMDDYAKFVLTCLTMTDADGNLVRSKKSLEPEKKRFEL